MRVFDFDHAIVREPSRNVVNGLRADQSSVVRFEDVAAEHTAYVAALREAGLQVDVLPALEEFPDSVFVEDPALVFPEGAILMRPGAPARMGETAKIADAINRHFKRVLRLKDDEHADGGDILVTPQIVFIGLSARTTQKGAEALVALLGELGRKARIVETPKGVLHLKSASGLVDDNTVVATRALAQSEIFSGFNIVEIENGESAASNLLRINDVIFMDDRFTQITDRVKDRGIAVKSIRVRETAKLDAGLSCMSLRWHAAN